MSEKDKTVLIYLPVAILIGPAITVTWIWLGKSSSRAALIPAIGMAGILILVTAISALIVRKLYPHTKEITGKTILVSYIITIITLVITAFRNPWFPIIIVMAPVYATPTLLAFSFFWAQLTANQFADDSAGSGAVQAIKPADGWKCPECGSINHIDISLCSCGYYSNGNS